jgi:hypothetical protein
MNVRHLPSELPHQFQPLAAMNLADLVGYRYSLCEGKKLIRVNRSGKRYCSGNITAHKDRSWLAKSKMSFLKI